MAERRYGFRFSFAEGCIIVVSIMGASFLVFLFGVYAGRELEARKAAEHTSTVRLTALTEGEAPGASKEGREKSTPAPSAPLLSGKPTTVVIVPSPRPSDASNAAPTSGSASLAVPQNKTLATGPDIGQKPQVPVASEQPAKKELFAAPVLPPGVHVAPPEKSPTVLQEKEPHANSDLSEKTQANPANLKATPTPSVTLRASEEKKQIVQVMQAAKKEQTPFLARPSSSSPGRWSVQVQAMRDEEGARQLVRALQSQGYAPIISRVVRDGEIWYRVRVGSFTSADEARASVEQLRRAGKFSQAYPVSN